MLIIICRPVEISFDCHACTQGILLKNSNSNHFVSGLVFVCRGTHSARAIGLQISVQRIVLTAIICPNNSGNITVSAFVSGLLYYVFFYVCMSGRILQIASVYGLLCQIPLASRTYTSSNFSFVIYLALA